MYICLTSNANEDIYPENTRTNFTNRLPSSWTSKDGKPFYLTLKTIFISTADLAFQDISQVNYLKVHVFELEPQRFDQKFNHCAGGFQYPPKQELVANYCCYNFLHPTKLPLRYQHLDKLHIRITNNEDEDIEIKLGMQTILWIELTTEMTQQDQFTICCSSFHPNLFPGNTLNNFSSPLPTELYLPAYEVAMLNFIHPPFMKEKDRIIWVSINGRKIEWNLNKMRNTAHMLAEIKNDIESHGTVINRLKFSTNDGQVYIERISHPKVPTKRPMRIEISPDFSKAMGQTLKGQGVIILMPGERITFEGQPDVYLSLPYPVTFLHSSAIATNVCNGQYGNLLECIPLKLDMEPNIPTFTTFYEPQSLTFHPVANRPISSINFDFKNPDGSSRNFTSSNPADSIIINLLFRRKQ